MTDFLTAKTIRTHLGRVAVLLTIIALLAALPDDPDMRLLEGAALVEVG